VIYACPDCGGDLDREPFNFYCPACQASVSDPQVQGDTDD
jgi:Zn finger protein HypA/HybF involved in hydrogenase expression